MDGILEPDHRGRVTLSTQALAALARLRSSGAERPKAGRAVRAVLDEVTHNAPSPERVALAREATKRRRSLGARSLQDLTPEEVQRLRSGTA